MNQLWQVQWLVLFQSGQSGSDGSNGTFYCRQVRQYCCVVENLTNKKLNLNFDGIILECSAVSDKVVCQADGSICFAAVHDENVNYTEAFHHLN